MTLKSPAMGCILACALFLSTHLAAQPSATADNKKNALLDNTLYACLERTRFVLTMLVESVSDCSLHMAPSLSDGSAR